MLTKPLLGPRGLQGGPSLPLAGFSGSQPLASWQVSEPCLRAFAHAVECISHRRKLRPTEASTLLSLSRASSAAGPGTGRPGGHSHCNLVELTPPLWAPVLICGMGAHLGALSCGKVQWGSPRSCHDIAGGGYRQRERDQPAVHPALPSQRRLHPPPAA